MKSRGQNLARLAQRKNNKTKKKRVKEKEFSAFTEKPLRNSNHFKICNFVFEKAPGLKGFLQSK